MQQLQAGLGLNRDDDQTCTSGLAKDGEVDELVSHAWMAGNFR
ncbi:hypothetical protein NHF46_06050 [Arthrobacter alpinus]|nr:hypothetical protein [Arthrobacter alpinus]